MRAAVYLRQSQDRTGEGLGIDRQRDDVRRLVESRGWTMAAEFVDNDVSALSRKPRPQFSAMMARVDAGEFDVIVARHMDRLLRRLAELETVLERCQLANVAIVTAADGVDTSTDGGRLVARILSSVAQGEVERKGARQRSAAVQAAKQGRWVGGRRAFGYEADGVTIREDEAALIKQGYADVLAGESLGEIARRWTASGIRSTQGSAGWHRGSVKDVLTTRVAPGCDGTAPSRNERRSGRTPSWVLPAPPSGPRSSTSQPGAPRCASCATRCCRAALGPKGLLTGVAVCGVCEQSVHRGGSAHGKPAYRCRSGRPDVSRMSEPVDEYVEAVVLEVLKRPDAALLWTADLPDADQLMAEADTLRRRRDDLSLDYADGVMTREQFRSANERVLGRLGDIEAKIAAAGSASPLAIVAVEDVESRGQGCRWLDGAASSQHCARQCCTCPAAGRATSIPTL